MHCLSFKSSHQSFVWIWSRSDYSSSKRKPPLPSCPLLFSAKYTLSLYGYIKHCVRTFATWTGTPTMPPLTPRKRLHEPEPASTPIHNRATTMHGATSSHYVLDQAHRVAEQEMRDKYEKIDVKNFLDLLPEAKGKVRRSGEYRPDESGNAAVCSVCTSTVFLWNRCDI